MQTFNKCYSELITIPTFEERLEYLLLHGSVGKDTFAWERYLNQILYKSSEWKKVRREVILRDAACDLACDGYEIPRRALIHHINPITVDDVRLARPIVFDMENLITTTLNTHEIIHYGNLQDIQNLTMAERLPDDTTPWR